MQRSDGQAEFSFQALVPDDIAVLHHRWHSALGFAATLPPYEEIMLGSLGRLADHVALLRGPLDAMQMVNIGRYVRGWLDSEAPALSVADVGPDRALAIMQAARLAVETRSPQSINAHSVRDGVVQAYNVLALPLVSRWDGVVIGLYVNKKGGRYNLLDAFVGATNDGVVSVAAVRDASGRVVDFQIVHLNDGAARLIGLAADQLIWHRIRSGNHALASDDVVGRLAAVMESGSGDQFEITSADRDLRLSAAVFGDLLSLTISDVTDLKRRERSVRLLFEDNPMPMWVFELASKCFVAVNDAAVAHYGYDRDTFLRMSLIDILAPGEHAERIDMIDYVVDAVQGESWRHARADGREIDVMMFGRRVDFDGRDACLVACVDVTARRKAEKRIVHMAHHDALTNLPNRVAYRRFLRRQLGRARRSGASLAVLCIDLDLFKNVNDQLGHHSGDRLLELVSARLRAECRDGDFVARLGGDEFAVVLGPVGSREAVASCCSRLIARVSEPYDINGNEVVIGASVGIAMAPDDGYEDEQLLRHADMALYKAKADGGGTFCFFSREMDEQAQKRRAMESDLRRAQPAGELEVHYQPIVDALSGRVVACEALLRWRHSEHGLIPPGEFIPVAERLGIIVQIGEWVLEQACRTAVTWPSDVRIAVNLSPVQFRARGLARMVAEILGRTGLSPERLDLEITESILLADTEANLATLHQLKDLGVAISMDDFGTGYSSLSYLRSFPFDKIKIDRSFIRDVTSRPDCLAIVRAITSLGRSLNICTIAEGVESAAQLDQLRSEGCAQLQGFLFSAARPAGEITKFFAQESADQAAA